MDLLRLFAQDLSRWSRNPKRGLWKTKIYQILSPKRINSAKKLSGIQQFKLSNDNESISNVEKDIQQGNQTGVKMESA